MDVGQSGPVQPQVLLDQASELVDVLGCEVFPAPGDGVDVTRAVAGVVEGLGDLLGEAQRRPSSQGVSCRSSARRGGGDGSSPLCLVTCLDTAGWLMPVRRAILSWVQPRSAKSLIISARSPRISSPARMTSFMSANIRSACASVRGSVGGSGVRRVSSSTAIARLYTQAECPNVTITRLYNPVV